MTLPRHLPAKATRLAVLLALLLVPLLPAGREHGYILLLAARATIFALAALSLEFILGAAGLVSFGHAAYLGIGAYAVAILDANGITDLLLVVPAAMAAGAVFALATGAVALRTRGVNFIMITLAFAQMLYFLASSLSSYGGDDGYTLYARSTLLGWNVLAERTFQFAAALVLTAAYLALRVVLASRFGRALQATRQNAQRAQSLGLDPFRLQLMAYVGAGALCAVAGVLLANATEFTAPAFAAWQRSGDLLIMVILGALVGTRLNDRLLGAIIGALAVVLIEEALGRFTEHWRLIFGPLLVLAVLAAPRR